MFMSDTVEWSELREYLQRRHAERRDAARDRDLPPAEVNAPPGTDPRILQLIAEGKARPPRRWRTGPLPKALQPFGEVDKTEAASRALEYVRGYR
jgi:hypothetical protein